MDKEFQNSEISNNLKYQIIEEYKNNVLCSMLFGKLFFKYRSFFGKFFGKWFLRVLFIVIAIGVIFPIGQFVPTIVFATTIFMLKIFIIVAIIYFINFIISMVFPQFPRIAVKSDTNVHIIFYLFLILININYVTLIDYKINNYDIEYNLYSVLFYSFFVNMIFVVTFELTRILYYRFIHVDRIALEYLYRNYKRMDTNAMDRMFCALTSRSKQFRLYIVTLTSLISMKFILFYAFNISQYEIDAMKSFNTYFINSNMISFF